MWFNFIRMFFQKTCIRRKKDARIREYKKKHSASKSFPQENNTSVMAEYYHDLQEWDEKLQSIEDAELVRDAKKAGVYLDEITLPEYDKYDEKAIRGSYYRYGYCSGEKLLDDEVRKQLKQAYRNRLPEYRKERRETIELYIKAGGVLIGILGAISGVFAVYNKCG